MWVVDYYYVNTWRRINEVTGQYASREQALAFLVASGRMGPDRWLHYAQYKYRVRNLTTHPNPDDCPDRPLDPDAVGYAPLPPVDSEWGEESL